MIKLAVFDLDGTLCDTIEDLAASVNFALSSLGFKTHPTELYKYMVGNGMKNLVFRALPEENRSEAEVEKAKSIMLEYYKYHYADKTRIYDGINDLLSRLKKKGIHIAVCTNKAHDMALKVIEQLFPNTFETVIGKSDDRPLKPDPYSVKEIMESVSVKNTETVFIGDSGVDIKTAINSETIPIGVIWGFRDETELKQNGAVHIAQTPNDILEIIKNLEV